MILHGHYVCFIGPFPGYPFPEDPLLRVNPPVETIYRHSPEEGNLLNSYVDNVHEGDTWIPACAGMTNYFYYGESRNPEEIFTHWSLS